MKTINTLLHPFLLSALAILLTGCGSSPTAVMDDMISEMNGLTEVLEGIESQEDYDSAQDDIEKRAKKIEYFVNHCDSTACTFPPGHAGLCSHLLVSGKRHGRTAREARK